MATCQKRGTPRLNPWAALFLLFANDIPEGLNSAVKLFADDTKVYRSIQSPADANLLQADLNTLAVWSSKWLVNFNAVKCVVLRERAAINFSYTLNKIVLKEVNVQRDLGIDIANNLKPSAHVQRLCEKAN